MNSVRPTRLVGFAGGFPFRSSRNDNEMATPITFKWKGKSNLAVSKNLLHILLSSSQ